MSTTSKARGRLSTFHIAVALPLMGLACATERESVGELGSTGLPPSVGDDAGGETDSGGDENPLRLDVEPATGGRTAGGDEQEGCTKVDFLFVIDSSDSMLDKQQRLQANSPGFIRSIEDDLGLTDVHVLVTDTDAGGETVCNPYCVEWRQEQGPLAGNCPFTGVPCTVPRLTKPEVDALPACDLTMGAGIVHPRGEGAASMDCGFPDGRRWLHGSDPQLESAFVCASQVGVGGDDTERPVDAIVAAIGAEAEAGGCNEGFLRPDALLVVTILSDEGFDNRTAEELEAMKAAVVAGKGGNEDAIVMIGLLSDRLREDAVCTAGLASKQLIDWVELFTHGSWASVCQRDYRQTFREAVDLVGTACDAFIPPG